MYTIFSGIWLIIGIIFIAAGRPFLEVAACFVLFGILSGCTELYLIRKELQSKEIERILKEGD